MPFKLPTDIRYFELTNKRYWPLARERCHLKLPTDTRYFELTNKKDTGRWPVWPTLKTKLINQCSGERRVTRTTPLAAAGNARPHSFRPRPASLVCDNSPPQEFQIYHFIQVAEDQPLIINWLKRKNFHLSTRLMQKGQIWINQLLWFPLKNMWKLHTVMEI